MMTTYNVTIPENKKSFFLEFLKLIDAQYEKKDVQKFQVSAQQKQILDREENLPLSAYQDHDEFLEELKEEYGF